MSYPNDESHDGNGCIFVREVGRWWCSCPPMVSPPPPYVVVDITGLSETAPAQHALYQDQDPAGHYYDPLPP